MTKLRVLVACLGMVVGVGASRAEECASNGVGGGPWSEPATWKNRKVPGPEDDVVLQKNDVVAFDRDDDGKTSCRKLFIDPRGVFTFKTNAGKLVFCAGDVIESFGLIRLDGTKNPKDFFELRLVSQTPGQRHIKLLKGSGLLFYGHAKPAGQRRNVGLVSTKVGEQKDDLLGLVRADGGVMVDVQRAAVHNVKFEVFHLDNTGSKFNEAVRFTGNQFSGLGRVYCHTCDSPVISGNSFDCRKPLTVADAAIYTGVCPLAEIKGNVIGGGGFAYGIIFSSNTDSFILNNVIDGVITNGIHGNQSTNCVIRNCQVANVTNGLHMQWVSGLIENTSVSDVSVGLVHLTSMLQATTLRVSKIRMKGAAVYHGGGGLTLLNCGIEPEQVNLGKQEVMAPGKPPPIPVVAQEYLVVGAKKAPAGAVVEVRTVKPAPAKDAVDTNTRNSPAPLHAGLSPLPGSSFPLILKSWTLDSKGKTEAPEYVVMIYGPETKGNVPRAVLATQALVPSAKMFRSNPDEPVPTLEVPLK